MSTAIPHFKLNNGHTIPSVGLGCWMGQPAGDKENTATLDMVSTALKVSFTHFDTASGYGNEEAVGKAIRAYSGKRSDLFVTTKLGGKDHGSVKEALETSLAKLDIGYIDLFLMHWPQAQDPKTGKPIPRTDEPTFEDTWAAMEALLDGGKVKSIGVSNFSLQTLDALLRTAKVVPAVNQVEVHPYLPQEELVQYCTKKGIHVTAYCPLGQYNSPILKDAAVVSIAEAHKATPGQVLLSWNVARGISVVPKSANEGRLKANITLLQLTKEEVTAITALHNESGKYQSLCDFGPGLAVPNQVFGWSLDDMGWDSKAFSTKW